MLRYSYPASKIIQIARACLIMLLFYPLYWYTLASQLSDRILAYYIFSVCLILLQHNGLFCTQMHEISYSSSFCSFHIFTVINHSIKNKFVPTNAFIYFLNVVTVFCNDIFYVFYSYWLKCSHFSSTSFNISNNSPIYSSFLPLLKNTIVFILFFNLYFIYNHFIYFSNSSLIK